MNSSHNPRNNFAPGSTCNRSQVRPGDIIAGYTKCICPHQNQQNDLYTNATQLRKTEQGGVIK